MISSLGDVIKTARLLSSRHILTTDKPSDAECGDRLGKERPGDLGRSCGLRHRHRPRLEGLETRRLLSVSVKEIPLPESDSLPVGITTGRGGDLWFTEQVSNKIGEINPRTDAIREFTIPTPRSFPGAIIAGSDGNLWFTEQLSTFGQEGPLFAGKLGEINPRTHTIQEFLLPSGTPTALTSGPRGTVWFTANAADGTEIGRINLKTHVIQEFSLPVPAGSYVPEITTDARHNLDFAGVSIVSTSESSILGEFNPRTLTARFDPNLSGIPSSLTTGADGNLWFTQTPSAYATNSDLVSLSPWTKRTQTFPLSSRDPLVSAVMTQTQDHNFWITANNESNIWQFNPRTHAVSEFPLPTNGTQGITAGTGRQLWITQAQISYFRGISPDGGFGGFVQVVGESSLAQIRYSAGHR